MRIDDAVDGTVVEGAWLHFAAGVQGELGVLTTPGRRVELHRRRGRGIGNETGRRDVLAGPPVSELKSIGGHVRRLKLPDGPRHIGVVDAGDVGLQRRLAQQCSRIVRDHVAAVGVVQQVGAEVGGLESEPRRGVRIGHEPEPSRGRAQPAAVGRDDVAATREAVHVHTVGLSPGLGAATRRGVGAEHGIVVTATQRKHGERRPRPPMSPTHRDAVSRCAGVDATRGCVIRLWCRTCGGTRWCGWSSDR